MPIGATAIFALTLALDMVTFPLAVEAHRRAGCTGSGSWRHSASGYAPQVEAFRGGLRDLGYVEGKNLVIEFRWAEGNYARLPDLAAELVRLKPDVLVTHAPAGTLAAKQATATIPIVMGVAGDAVAMRARREPRAPWRERHRVVLLFPGAQRQTAGGTQGSPPTLESRGRPSES